MRALQEAVLPEVDGISAGDLIRHLKAVTGQSYVEVGMPLRAHVGLLCSCRGGALRNC